MRLNLNLNRKERTMALAIGLNVFVILLKFFLANVSGSLAMSASAWHSFADIFVGVFVMVGLVASRTEAAAARRTGRFSLIENGVALVVAGFIFVMGANIFWQATSHPMHMLMNTGPVALTSLLTIVAAFVTSRLLLYVGRQEDSPSLIASGYHAQMELWEAIVVVTGLAGSALGIQSLDRAAAVLVVLFVGFAGYDIGASALTAIRARSSLDVSHGQHHRRPVWRAFAPVALVALAGIYFASGFYTVQPDERAVVRRFGQVVGTAVDPGLHYRLPWPVEQVNLVSVTTVRRAETDRALMLTGDENLINMRLGVHYVIADPARYLFRVTNVEGLVTAAAEAAVRQVVAEESVDNVLTVDKSLIQSRAAKIAQGTLDAYESGLRIVDVQLLESSPPEAVADAFRDVSSAREDKQTVVNEALAYQNEIIPAARGEAAQAVYSAQTYAAEKTSAASGEAERFAARQEAHAALPAITHIRLYLEAIETVLPGVRKFIVDPAVTLQTTDLWFSDSSTITSFPPQ